MYTPAFSAVLFALSFASAAVPPNTCPPSQVSVRLPPYLDPVLNGSSNASSNHSSSASFLAPPPGFYEGTWYLTNCSSAIYRSLSNIQWDLRPVLPSCEQNTTASCPPGTLGGTMADLTTWALNGSSSGNATASYDFGALGGGNRSVASILGYDTPRRLKDPELGAAWDGVFDIQVSGALESGGYTEAWSVLFWGLDAKAVPFMIVHENTGSIAQTPPCLDAWTRNPAGPDPASLAEVMEALMELGSSDLKNLVKELGPTKWDHGLQGGPPICGKGCQKNMAQ